MRVLVVTNMYPTADRPYFGIFVARQVESLRRAGLDVAVEPIAGPRGRADYLLARRRVGRRVAEFGPDVVHVHFGYAGVAGLGHGPPAVLTLHGSDVHGLSGAGWRRRMGALISRRAARRADRIIVQTDAMRRQLPRSLQNIIGVIPNGIDEDLFRPLPRDQARARLGLEGADPVLLFVDGSGSANKRRDLAEAAVAELLLQGCKATLLVAGQVPPADMPWYYGAADALLLTSDREGSPMCVKESLACGTPVVSVPVGDVAELLDAERRGIIAPRDPAAIARALISVLGRPAAAESLLPARLRDSAVAAQVTGLYQDLTYVRSSE